jgi:hypothetical protein
MFTVKALLRPLPLAASVGVAVLAFMPASASAVQVVVSGQFYEVSTFQGTANANAAKFTTADMPWFGNQSLASAFATAVGSQLGLTGLLSRGPFFAYSRSTGFIPALNTTNNSVFSSLTGTTVSNIPVLRSINTTYAVATEVPGPLPLLGVGAAFGLSRKLRCRIRRSNAVQSLETSA